MLVSEIIQQFLFQEFQRISMSMLPGNNHVNVAVIFFTAVAGVAVAALIYAKRGHLKYTFGRKRRRPLLPRDWLSAFTSEGKLCDDGIKVLQTVCNGGIDSRIRAEVWPFLLGVYNLNSTKQERELENIKRREEYEQLRKQCKYIQPEHENIDPSDNDGIGDPETVRSKEERTLTGSVEYVEKPGESVVESENRTGEDCEVSDLTSAGSIFEQKDRSISDEEYISEYDAMVEKSSEIADCAKGLSEASSDNESIVEDDFNLVKSPATKDCERTKETPFIEANFDNIEKLKNRGPHAFEDYSTWQRIIRLDAVRMNAEWVPFSSSQANVSEEEASTLAHAVGLKNDEHLEPCRKHHAARLVAILEAYALYDPEIGYCQGMSDLLSPFVALMDEDYEAFWCFVHFMHEARHNFRVDEVGIRRQLSTVAKIIKETDPHLYNHLEKIQAEDFFFVYRMVVVLFRREMTFEQTLCLWEVIWANQVAARVETVKTAWRNGKLKAPPSNDLLLYAIAASVLQKRKIIIENYTDVGDILRECNSMAGHLDVWKLLDEAYDLVFALHGKV